LNPGRARTLTALAVPLRACRHRGDAAENGRECRSAGIWRAGKIRLRREVAGASVRNPCAHDLAGRQPRSSGADRPPFPRPEPAWGLGLAAARGLYMSVWTAGT